MAENGNNQATVATTSALDKNASSEGENGFMTICAKLIPGLRNVEYNDDECQFYFP